MKTGFLLKNGAGKYYIHKNEFGTINEAKVFFDFEEARKKALSTCCTLEHVEVRYKVLESE